MKIFWKTLFTVPLLFSEIVGLSINQFNELHQCLESRFPTKYCKRLGKQGKLLLCLIYMRQYCSQGFLAWIFGVSKSTISRNVESILSELEHITVSWLKFADYGERMKNSVTFRGAKLVLIVDGTEQQVSIPSKKLLEQACFSGKKKKHTFTRLLGVSPRGHIYYVGEAETGSNNDLNSYHKSEIHNRLTKKEWIGADKGFRGCQNYHKFVLPYFESPLVKLTSKQQEFNNSFARIRTVVENSIAQVKKWKICRNCFRCKFADLDKALLQSTRVWKVCAALVNKFNFVLHSQTK